MVRRRTARLGLGMDQREKQNLMVAAAVVVLIALCLWLGHLLEENIRIQNCVFSGRRNCNPIPMDQ